MKFQKKMKVASVTFTTVALAGLLSLAALQGCASTEGSESTFDVPQPTYGQQPPSVKPVVKSAALNNPTNNTSAASDTSTAQSSSKDSAHVAPRLDADANLMRHSLRQIVEYDTYKMSRLVDRETNSKNLDNDAYLSQLAITLGQTVMLQPHFTEREGALRELKGKVDQDDYVLVIERATNDLLSIVRSSNTPSDQAGAMIALTNIVTEIRTLKRPELKSVLQKIADANLQVSDQAKQYAKDPMEKLVSPSDEAQAALKKFEG